jgi:DNA-binding NarL/FixJ family response regulator
MIRLFILDDHYIISKGLKESFRYTNSGIEVTGYSNDLSDALSFLHVNPVDIFLLDLYMPKNNPIINLRIIRNKFPSLKIAIFTVEDSLFWRLRMYHEGAQGFIVKSESIIDIKIKLKLIAEGYTILLAKFGRRQFPLLDEKKILSITPNSLDILYDMYQGMNMKELAYKFSTSISSISNVLVSTRKKLCVTTTSEFFYLLFN